MNHHDNIAVCDVNEAHFVPPLETFGDKLSILHTVAHYISPKGKDVAFTKGHVAMRMGLYGMDIIPVCGDQLAEEEGIDEDLGLILEHQADAETDEFQELVEKMKACLDHVGWNYDGWVGEYDEELGQFEEDIIIH